MFQNIIEIIKMPVTTIIEQSKKEDLKKGAIKGLILSAIVSLISIISTFFSIIKSVTKDSFWYGERTSSEVWELRWEKIEDAKLFSSFFKQILVYVIVIAIVALILYIIAKLLKSQKDYSETLSMTNSIFILFGIGMLVNIILSLIYAPLGIIVTLMINIYAILSLIHAFKESLDTVDVNQLVLVSTGVIIATVTIVAILLMIVCDISFKDLSSVTSLMSSLSSSSSDVSSLLDF